MVDDVTVSVALPSAALKLALFAAFLLQTASASMAEERFNLAPPEAVTLKIVAMRGCIEGVRHPSAQGLSNSEQIAACNEFVKLAEDKIMAAYYRGLHLYENGTIQAHRAQAYRDFTFVIDAGADIASAFGNRAMLNLLDRNAPENALQDIDKAIELTSKRPRPSFLGRRAAILLSMAENDGDEAMVYAALTDIETAKSLGPAPKFIAQLEAWALEFLNKLHRRKGHTIKKG